MAADAVDATSEEQSLPSSLTQDIISKLRFRDLRRELEGRDLDVYGTTAQLRARLREAALGVEEMCAIVEPGQEEACEVRFQGRSMNGID